MLINKELELSAKLDNLPQFIEFAVNCGIEYQLNKKQIFNIELALEEALVNLINYAYKYKEGNIKILCGIDEVDFFTIEIFDNGIPFDITDLKDPDLSSDIDERKVGGLGVFLIKKLMDDVKYRSENDKNILTLIIKIKKT